MADKTVTYKLLADITQFRAQMAQAATSVQTTADRMTAATKEGKNFRTGLTTLGSAAGKVGLVAAAGLAAAVVSAANFDQSMSRVQAATHDSAANMDLLRNAAIDAGRVTVFSASGAADAITALAKAGVSTKDILGGGLVSSLNLASAGELDVAQAADIAATTMNQFGLAGGDVAHIADVLSAAAGKAQGDVTDMAEALKYVGPVAAQMGVSLDQTVGTIAELASQGILGSQAGTSLRGMLTALTSPSTQAANTMKQLGINVYDASGQFVGFDGVATQLHDHMKNLTAAERDEALGRIFGNQQITAARILYAGGGQAVKGWTASVNDSGYAAQTAAIKLNNLKGDLEQFKGSLETLLIGLGEGSQGPLRGLVQGLTGITNAITKLPDGAKSATTGLLGLTAITGGGLWFTAKAANAVASMRNALSQLGDTAPKTAAGLKAVGIALVGLEALRIASDSLDSLVRSFDAAAPSAERLARNLALLGTPQDVAGLDNFMSAFGNLGAEIDATDSRMGKAATSTQNFLNKIPLVGATAANQIDFIDKVTGSSVEHLREAQAAFASLDTALMQLAQSQGPKAARQAFDELAQSYHLTADQQKQLLSQLPQFNGLMQDTSNIARGTIPNIAALVGPLRSVSTGLGDAASHANDLKAALQTLQGFLDKRDAFRNYQAALDDFRQHFKSAAGFNINIDPGRQNQAKLDAIAQAAGQVASKLHGVAQVHFVNGVISQLRTMADNMHLPQKQVDVLISALKQLTNTPANPKVKVQGVPQAHSDITGVAKSATNLNQLLGGPTITANATPAMSAIAAVRSAIGALISHPWSVFIGTTGPGATHHANGGIVEYYAKGGLREHHVAQIAPAGAMRIWAEPETGGEAYIPLAPSKRDRSRAIAAEVVSRLGGHVQFANGGVNSVNWISRPSGAIRIEGPVEIRGRLNPITGELVGTMEAIAGRVVDDASDFNRTMRGRRR